MMVMVGVGCFLIGMMIAVCICHHYYVPNMEDTEHLRNTIAELNMQLKQAKEVNIIQEHFIVKGKESHDKKAKAKDR